MGGEAFAPLPYPTLLDDAQVERAVELGMRPARWGGDAAAAPSASVLARGGSAAALPSVGERPDPPELSAALRTLVGECWATDPSRRPRTAAEVLGRLDEVAPPAAVAAALTALSAAGAAAAPAAAAATPRTAAVPATLAPALASWRPAFRLPGACPVCADDGSPALPGVRTGCGTTAAGGAQHALCLSCALRHVRAELLPGATAIRCPQCLADRGSGTMTVAAVAEIAAWSRLPGRPDATGPLRPLSDDELARHAAMVAAEERRAREAALPEGLFKRCPSCGTGVIRARGPHCHHREGGGEDWGRGGPVQHPANLRLLLLLPHGAVSPGTGCLNCHAHFCYACLHLYRPGENVHRCPTGCQLFCWPGCDCPDCTECRPG